MKLFQKKTNTNSIKAMNSLSNTPNIKAKNFESTVKNILKEVEEKVGSDCEGNNLKSFKNKEKITSKIIEKYKRQIREKDTKDKTSNKVLATSYKENLDPSNMCLLTKNKSVENNIGVGEYQKVSLLTNSETKNIIKPDDPFPIPKQTESHREVAKVLAFGQINKDLNNMIRESSSVDKKFALEEKVQQKNTLMEEFLRINRAKQTFSKDVKQSEMKTKNASYQKEMLLNKEKKDKSNPNLIWENKENPLATQTNNLTPKHLKETPSIISSNTAISSTNKPKKNNLAATISHQQRNQQITNILNKLNRKKGEEDEEEYFSYEEDKKNDLNNDEKLIYGNREPKGYTKLKLLGKGGCGIVWLGKNAKGEIVAIKQISKKNIKSDVSHFARKEIEIFNFLSQTEQNSNMIKLLDYLEDSYDFWLIFEKGGHNFGSLLFKIKGDFHNSERIYLIQKGKFLKHMFQELTLFKDLFGKMLNFLHFLTSHGIVHCDIKPDNILIDYEVTEGGEAKITNLKLIDFGSAFYLRAPDNFNSNTPEYMSPEINEINEKGGNGSNICQFIKELNPWSIDMWSLGVTILEVVLACPSWMSYKTKIKRNNKVIFTTGLFGVKGRSNVKIHQKQIEVAKNIKTLLQDCLIADAEEREKFTDLMQHVLDINWKTRISPIEALSHPFFN